MAISCYNYNYLNQGSDSTTYPYILGSDSQINYGNIQLKRDTIASSRIYFSVKCEKPSDANYFVDYLRNNRVKQMSLSVNLPFTYAGYSWNLKATSQCNSMSSSSYPKISFMGIDTFCVLTKNDSIVYNQSRRENTYYTMSFEDNCYRMLIEYKKYEDTWLSITNYLPTDTTFTSNSIEFFYNIYAWVI